MRDPIIPTRTRANIESDNRAELDAWIDERAADLIAQGLAPADARRRALEEFGDVVQARRYAEREDVAADRRVRIVLYLEELGADLRIALRTLARTPGLTTIVLLTFALGIGATTAVFSLVHAMLLRPLPYGDEKSLVYLPSADNGIIRRDLGGARHSVTAFVALRERTTSFAAIAGVENGNWVITDNGDPEQVTGSSVTPNVFEVLQARAALGRTFAPSQGDGTPGDVVVLLDALWRRRFGADSHIIGRTIDFSGTRRRVIGIMPSDFRVPTYEHSEFLVPRDIRDLLRNPDNHHVRYTRLFARLKPAVTLSAAQTDVDRTMRRLQMEFPQTYGGVEARVMPVRTAIAGDVKPRVLVLMGAAVFVLLIACANVAGILLSRAIARRHELSVRVALGAGRGRLVRQFLTEGTMLAVLGAGIGLLVAQGGIVALRGIAKSALPAGTAFALEPRVLLFGLGAAVVGALAASLVPALGATRVPHVALRRDDGRASVSHANRQMRLGLVALQLAVSVVLLVGAGLFLRTLQRLAALDLGYSTEQAMTFRLQFTRPMPSEEQDVLYMSLYEQLRAIPGVVAVGGGNVPTSGQGTVTPLEIEGRTVANARPPDVRYTPASDGYFTALGIRIVRGRAFNAEDREGAQRVALVSESLARQVVSGGDPIGARVRPGPRAEWATVVGVAGDVRMGGADAPQPTVYTAQRQDYWPGGSGIIIRVSGDAEGMTSGVRQVVKRVDPSLVIVGLRTLEDFRRSTPAIAERRLQMQLMLVFALVALAVSAIGVYGVVAYAAEARRREFGIRMALGASGRGVLWLALRDGAGVAAVGALLGIPLALLLATRMRQMLFEVAPFDLLTVGSVVTALFVVVAAASLVPARRATMVDPTRAMRTD